MLLINAGADVNAINRSGDTALLAALHFGNVERVRELLAAGADVNKKNKYGDSTVTLAARYGHGKSLNLLLQAGISHGEITHSLINTVEKGNSKCIDLLLEAGADVNARSSTGETPLLLATKNQYNMSTQALRSLINAGADVNAIDRDQNTALHFAASFYHFKLLLLAGAHVNKVDNTGSTALQKCLKPSPSLPVGLDLNYRSKCLNVAEVLFAAGDSFNLNERITLNRPSVSKLEEMMVPRMDLKDMCRHKIRNHLLSIDSMETRTSTHFGFVCTFQPRRRFISLSTWNQWRIQDFPEEGAPTLKEAIIWPFFPKNCMKLKEFGPQEGARVLAPPLRSANGNVPITF